MAGVIAAELGVLQKWLLEHGRAASNAFTVIKNRPRPKLRAITGALGHRADLGSGACGVLTGLVDT